MHVGIDARLTYYAQGGISQYITQLVRALCQIDREDKFTIFQNRQGPKLFEDQLNFTQRFLRTPCHFRLEQWALPLELAFSDLDVLHSPDFIPPFRRRCKAVITIHDLAFLRFPKLLTEESDRYYRQIKRAVESADGIIAVSQSTRRDLTELLGVPAERVDVIYHAADERFRPLDDLEATREFCQEHDLPETFILWVGTLEPRKNLETLLKALATLRDSEKGLPYKLVVVGAKGWLYESSLKLLDDLGLTDEVIFFGPASVTDLLLLYNAAWLFVFPSLYEGFGFPPLEAMACGTPVVSSRTSSLPEVLGEAALYFDPSDAEALAEAIQRVWRDPELRGELARRGLEQARRFSWKNTAEQTLALYRRISEQ